MSTFDDNDAAKDKESKSCPALFYYDCGTERCITDMLTCDDVDNCGNRSDEIHCRELHLTHAPY